MLVIDKGIQEETYKDALATYHKKLRVITIIALSLLGIGLLTCIFNLITIKGLDYSTMTVEQMDIHLRNTFMIPVACIAIVVGLNFYGVLARKPLSSEAQKANEMYKKSDSHLSLLYNKENDSYHLYHVYPEDGIVKTLMVKVDVEKVDGEVSTITEEKRGKLLLMLSKNVEIDEAGNAKF